MGSYSNFSWILQIQLYILTQYLASAQNSPSPQLDPDWISQGWYCQQPNVPDDNGIVDCIKVLPGTALLQDADRLCASLKRDKVDLIVPTLLVINSKEEQDSGQWLNQIKLAAGILNGGSVGFWVGSGTFRDSHGPRTTTPRPPSSQGPPPRQLSFPWIFNDIETEIDRGLIRTTQLLSEEPTWSRPDCGELRIEVVKQSLNSSTKLSWNPMWCTDRSRVICRTRKVKVSYLLELLERQRKEWSNLYRSFIETKGLYWESQREVDRLNARDCGWKKSAWDQAGDEIRSWFR